MKQKTYAGLVVKVNNKVLLCKRNATGSYPGMWSIPGGKVEKGESTLDGVRREFFEETAINISNEELNFVGLIPRHNRDGSEIKGQMYVYLLELNKQISPDLENAIDGNEHTDCGYFSEEEISPEKCGTNLHKLLSTIFDKSQDKL